jgi:hypothetical protein
MRAPLVCLALLGIWGCQNQRGLPVDVLHRDRPKFESDPYDMKGIRVEGDSLVVEVGYGGGCRTHAFELMRKAPLVRSMPPKWPLDVVHRADGDPCRAWIQERLAFDLVPFRASPHGVTVLLVGDTLLTYSYE